MAPNARAKAKTIRMKLYFVKGISLRQAAREVGISHTAITRAAEGVQIDLETVVRICNWLGVSPNDVLGTMGVNDQVMISQVVALIQSEPKLAQLFTDAFKDVEADKLSLDDLRDILNYATYRLKNRVT